MMLFSNSAIRSIMVVLKDTDFSCHNRSEPDANYCISHPECINSYTSSIDKPSIAEKLVDCVIAIIISSDMVGLLYRTKRKERPMKKGRNDGRFVCQPVSDRLQYY